MFHPSNVQEEMWTKCNFLKMTDVCVLCSDCRFIYNECYVSYIHDDKENGDTGIGLWMDVCLKLEAKHRFLVPRSHVVLVEQL